MAYTMQDLLELHKLPIIVRDVFTHTWYVILKKEPNGINTFEAKRVEPNTTEIPRGGEIHILHGGYPRWIYVSNPEDTGISPEDQKRIREIERKKANERITRSLKRDKMYKEADKRAKKVKKQLESSTSGPKIIDLFSRKKD